MASLKRMLLVIISVSFFNCAVGDDTIKVRFPPSTTTKFPRLQFIRSLPVLGEFTFCSWVRVYNMTERSPFIFSYATPHSDNEIAILLHSAENIILTRLHIGSPLMDFNCGMLNLRTQFWNHICVTWFSPNGRTEVFVNGDKCSSLRGDEVLSPGEIVRSGGIALIGQDQDAVNSKFDVKQAWYGDIADVHLWDEVLTRNQIQEAGKCGGTRKKGNVIAWLKTPMAVLDEAVFEETQLCQV